MRPRPKNIYQPSLANVSSLALALACLVFSLCIGNPNYDTAYSCFSLTFWWIFPFALLAFLDVILDRFVTRSWKGYSIASFAVAAGEILFLIICASSYFSFRGESDNGILLPRIAALILLIGVWLVGTAIRILSFQKPDEMKKPLVFERWCFLLFSLIILVFASFVWSIDKAVYTSVSADQIFLYLSLAAGVVALIYSLYLFLTGDKIPELNVIRFGMGIFLVAAILALVLIFIVAGSFTLSGSNNAATRVFYWSIFSMVGYVLSALSAGGYYAYVYYRLQN
jgi:hypothetical protein